MYFLYLDIYSSDLPHYAKEIFHKLSNSRIFYDAPLSPAQVIYKCFLKSLSDSLIFEVNL